MIVNNFQKVILNLNDITKCFVSVINDHFSNSVNFSVCIRAGSLADSTVLFVTEVHKSLNVFVVVTFKFQIIPMDSDFTLRFVEFADGMIQNCFLPS